MVQVQYYRRIEKKWLKGRVRNLTMNEAMNWVETLYDLFGPKVMIRIVDN